MNITKANYSYVANALVCGYNAAQNYNRECFGMSDLHLASITGNQVQNLIDKIKEVGYDPYCLLKPILETHKCFYDSDRDFSLKENLDDHFSIDVELIPSAYRYCLSVYDEYVEEASIKKWVLEQEQFENLTDAGTQMVINLLLNHSRSNWYDWLNLSSPRVELLTKKDCDRILWHIVLNNWQLLPIFKEGVAA